MTTKNNSNRASVNGLRAEQEIIELASLGLPRGYRNNPALLQALTVQPRRGFSLRKPANWAEQECLY